MNHKDVAESLLHRCRRQGILLRADGEHLIVDAPENSLTAGIVTDLRTHKAALLDLLRRDEPVYEISPNTDNDGELGDWLDWDALPEPVDCPSCGSFDCWWNVLGERRCTKCQPPAATSRRWLATVSRIRQRSRSYQDSSIA